MVRKRNEEKGNWREEKDVSKINEWSSTQKKKQVEEEIEGNESRRSCWWCREGDDEETRWNKMKVGLNLMGKLQEKSIISPQWHKRY